MGAAQLLTWGVTHLAGGEAEGAHLWALQMFWARLQSGLLWAKRGVVVVVVVAVAAAANGARLETLKVLKIH